jgi:hypothetical protein
MKVLKIVTGVIAVAGVVLLIGLAGSSDLAIELGEAHVEPIFMYVLGVLMAIPFMVVMVVDGRTRDKVQEEYGIKVKCDVCGKSVDYRLMTYLSEYEYDAWGKRHEISSARICPRCNSRAEKMISKYAHAQGVIIVEENENGASEWRV